MELSSNDDTYIVKSVETTLSRVVHRDEKDRNYYFKGIETLYISEDKLPIGRAFSFFCFLGTLTVTLPRDLTLPALLCRKTSESNLPHEVITKLVSWSKHAYHHPPKHHLTIPKHQMVGRSQLFKAFTGVLNYNLLAAQTRVEPGSSYLLCKDWEDWV